MAPTNDITAPPTPTPPPAPSLADLYGPQGNLVAAPPTTPAGISQHQGVSGSWAEGSVPDESQRTQLEDAGALPKARTTTQAASADIKKTGAVVQKVIDTPVLKSVASQIPGYDEATSAAHESAAWLKAHGHEKAANALSAYLGAESGADEFLSALTSPKNMMMLYSLGKLKTAGAGGEVLDRLISAKFSYDSIKDAYDSVPGVQKAIDGGDYETAARLITNAAGGFALGVSAAHGAVSGVNGGEAPEADTIRQRAADAQSTTPVAGRVDLTDLGDKPVETPAPEAGKVDLRSASGKALDERPAPEITADGPDWDRTHTAVIDGRKVGSVGMKVDAQGQAQIYGSVVNPELRGQGVGQKLYKSAIEDAKAQGADRITSDSTGVSPDAARVWEKLKASGEPVEEITHPNGKPGYQIDFTKKTPAVDVPEASEANELPVPENYKKNFDNGFTWPSVRAHEAGHAITADSVGFGVDAMYSHLDPNGSAGGLASQQVNYAGGDNPIQGAKEIPGSGGKYSLPLDSVRARLGDMLTVLVGGGVAQEHIGGIPFDSNPGLVGDMQFAKHLMKALDIPEGQQSELLQSARDRAKTILTHPAADGIIQKYTQTRAEGTPDALHMTADRVNDMVREHREARNGENGVSTQDNAAGHGEAANGVGEKPVAGREGKGSRGSDQSTQGRLFTAKSPAITSAGDEDNVDRGNSEVGNGTGAENVARGKGEAAPANNQVSPTQEVKPYHPDLQKVADKYGVSDDPAGVKNGASFIAPDGKFIHLGTTEHPDAIRWAGAGNREDFLDQTGAVRVRFNARDKAGPTTHISVPPQGVTEAEIPAIRQAIAQAGRNGNVVMERSDITPETRDTLSMSQDFPRASDTEDYLRKIQAHPDQHLKTHEIIKDDEGDSSFEFGANTEPENEAAASAQRYNAAKGQPEINHEAPPVNDARAKALAAEMDTHSHEPDAPEVKKSYKSLIADVKEQWNHAQKDLGIKFEPSEKDPYDSYEDVKKDVEENKRMKIYTGGNPLPEDHPLAKVDPKTGLTYNTMLRGVHDLYGHIAGNNDFSEQGESGATNAHRQMMSPESVPALLNETEGQVSQYFHGKDKGNFPPQNATIVPENFVKDWHQEAGERAAKEEAGGIDPRTGTSATEGVGSEILPERRQALDHAPTPADFKAFYEANRDVLDKNPDLKVGWDNNSKVPGGHEINIGIVGDDAARLAKKLDQTSAFDIGKGEVIPTKGSGLRTEFPNYSLEERIKDAKGEPLSNVKDFEHLSKDFYDHLEPDERDYLKGNKTLQRNAMSQYHKIDPSVAETTNAMASGAALGGWWQRYMDVFHELAGEEKGIPLYHASTSETPFEHFDPLIGGNTGEFGTHLGSVEQANDRAQNIRDVEDSPVHIRPVMAQIKNPLRLEGGGQNWSPYSVVDRLKKAGMLSKEEYSQLKNWNQQDSTHKYGVPNAEDLRNFLEKKGYDGIVYHNQVEGLPARVRARLDQEIEDQGLWREPQTDQEQQEQYPETKGNDSYIAFRPEQIKSKYSTKQIANTIGPAHSEVLKQWHAAVSGNKSVEDANNLAWHSYADWLDAGKPTDRTSINNIVKQNAAQPEGSEKKGNAAISDTLDKKGNVVSAGLDTSKLFALVNSPEMKGERPFSNDAFNEKTPNALVAKTEGARKIPSMGATVAGKGNLNRLVIDAHIRDFYGRTNSGGPAAQYIADSVHLRQAAEALGLKGGEGQEQLWGTVLGLKQLLKTGLTPEEAAGKLNSDVINQIGKDYAEVIANDPEITKPGGLLDRLKEKYGVGSGSAGVGEANRKASASRAGQAESRSSQTPVDKVVLSQTAQRILGQISESKIKKPATKPESKGWLAMMSKSGPNAK